MSDTTLVPVTAAQAATARANGHTVYAVTIPAQLVEMSTPDWATPPVTPPPPPSGSYSLGIAPPALAAGESVIFCDDFTNGLNTSDWGVYNGTSQPSSGLFVTKNTIVAGGELNLEMDQDFTNGTAANNYETGAGVQLISHTLHPGQRVEYVQKNVPMSGSFQIGLAFAADNLWPTHGEVDISEQDDLGAFRSTVIWGSSPSTKQQQQSPSINPDGTAHLWALAWTRDGHLNFYLDGVEYWTFPTPPAPFGAVGLNLCLQTQQEAVFSAPLIDWVRVVALP